MVRAPLMEVRTATRRPRDYLELAQHGAPTGVPFQEARSSLSAREMKPDSRIRLRGQGALSLCNARPIRKFPHPAEDARPGCPRFHLLSSYFVDRPLLRLRTVMPKRRPGGTRRPRPPWVYRSGRWLANGPWPEGGSIRSCAMTPAEPGWSALKTVVADALDLPIDARDAYLDDLLRGPSATRRGSASSTSASRASRSCLSRQLVKTGSRQTTDRRRRIMAELVVTGRPRHAFGPSNCVFSSQPLPSTGSRIPAWPCRPRRCR